MLSLLVQIDIGAGLGLVIVVVIAIVIYLFAGLRVIYQYERGVKFTFGSFRAVYDPGLRYVFPAFQSLKKVDLRVNTLDIPQQEVITKDNVSCKINAVIFYKVVQADKAVIEISNYSYAINQLAQSSLRDVVGTAELDTVLAKRDELGERIRKFVDEFTMPWGIHVLSVELKDVELPEAMKRSMAAQAEAERDKRARITLAEGEALAADRLLEAAKTIEQSPTALQLRLYQAMVRIGEENNSIIVLPVPIEILSMFGKPKKE
ncbi:MAG TPA: slipin family protein [Candidatus Acidoferrales bacterium]|jgi:regulator of protease activity HflC (stomatin/prohibitin superfamily)|nr:slipin family protein [Candidatus Acidoferrales bacterium]